MHLLFTRREPTGFLLCPRSLSLAECQTLPTTLLTYSERKRQTGTLNQIHRSDLWQALCVAPVLLLACPPPAPTTIPLGQGASTPTILLTGSQQECPGPPPAPPGESWVTTEDAGAPGDRLAPQPFVYELNAISAPSVTTAGNQPGSLLLTATATDPVAGISSVTLSLIGAGCEWENDAWGSPRQGQDYSGGLTLGQFNGTETGSYPNQQVSKTGTVTMVFDISNYLNGACSGTCLAPGSGNTYRSTANASGTPCCAEFTADQVDFRV